MDFGEYLCPYGHLSDCFSSPCVCGDCRAEPPGHSGGVELLLCLPPLARPCGAEQLEKFMGSSPTRSVGQTELERPAIEDGVAQGSPLVVGGSF